MDTVTLGFWKIHMNRELIDVRNYFDRSDRFWVSKFVLLSTRIWEPPKSFFLRYFISCFRTSIMVVTSLRSVEEPEKVESFSCNFQRCPFHPFLAEVSSVSQGVGWFIAHFPPSDYNDDKRAGRRARRARQTAQKNKHKYILARYH